MQKLANSLSSCCSVRSKAWLSILLGLPTFNVETRDHVTKLLRVLRQMLVPTNAFQSSETRLREPCGDPGELVWYAQVCEPFADQSKMADVLRLGWYRGSRRFEAFH